MKFKLILLLITFIFYEHSLAYNSYSYSSYKPYSYSSSYNPNKYSSNYNPNSYFSSYSYNPYSNYFSSYSYNPYSYSSSYNPYKYSSAYNPYSNYFSSYNPYKYSSTYYNPYSYFSSYNPYKYYSSYNSPFSSYYYSYYNPYKYTSSYYYYSNPYSYYSSSRPFMYVSCYGLNQCLSSYTPFSYSYSYNYYSYYNPYKYSSSYSYYSYYNPYKYSSSYSYYSYYNPYQYYSSYKPQSSYYYSYYNPNQYYSSYNPHSSYYSSSYYSSSYYSNYNCNPSTVALKFQESRKSFAKLPGKQFSSKLINGNQITIEMWIKISSSATDVYNPGYSQRVGYSSNTYIMFKTYLGTRLRKTFHSIGSWTWVPPKGVWFHVAQTINKNVGNTYINGVQKISSTISSYYPIFVDADFLLGIELGSFSGRKEYLDGWIAEFRIWNVARTLSEINNFKDKRLTGNEQGLIGYWPLNQNDGSSILKDISPNGLNGDINTAFWDNTISDLQLDCNNECLAPKWKSGTNCVETCPKLGDLSGEDRICVDSCPEGSIQDLLTNTCIAWDILYNQKTQYKPGDYVIIQDKIYQCKPAPQGWWCKQNAFQPDGMNGALAWNDVTGIKYIPIPSKDKLVGEYEAGINYLAGDVVNADGKFYRCLPWPVTAYCSQKAYEPTGIYGTVCWVEVDSSNVKISKEPEQKIEKQPEVVKQNSSNRKIPEWLYAVLIIFGLVILGLILVVGYQMKKVKNIFKLLKNEKLRSTEIFPKSDDNIKICSNDNIQSDEAIKI